MNASTDLERRDEEEGGALANKRLEAGLALGNGVIDPARWQMLAAIAETVGSTEFVPEGLRGSDKKVLACLLYGDALGLQPMTSLKEVHVIDGTPGLSAAAMAGLVRKAHPGHRMGREELRDAEGNFLGVRAFGKRGDTDETDEYTFTLVMAARANLMGKHNWKSYPEAMCTARAYSQLCTFLFPDVFMGSPYVPEEIESFGEVDNTVKPEGGEDGSPIVKPPAPAPEPAATESAGEQTEWEVADAETGENITYIGVDDRRSIAEAGAPFVKFSDVEGKFEIVGYEVDGATEKEKLLVRVAPGEQGKVRLPEGSPEAVVAENIPVILGKWVAEAQERGDRSYIEGVLAAEQAGKNRARLVAALQEIIGSMPDPAEAPDAEAPDAEAPLEDGAHDDDAVDEAIVELDPEIPFGSATQRAKVARLKALCAVMEDQYPEATAWRLEGVVASAAKQWGGAIESLEDLDEHQLELVWAAAEKYATLGVQFLALAKPVDIARMAESKDQA